MRISNEVFSDCKALNDITYNGTEEQWKSIYKGSDWNKNTPGYVVTCNDGTMLDKNGNVI